MWKVSITGGIGTGKSTVAKVFEILNIPVFEADKVAKKLIENDISLKSEIITLLGSQAYLPDNKYNTIWVAQKIYDNKSFLQKINALVHPQVATAYKEWCNNQNSAYIIKEAAIVYEKQENELFIYVDCPKSIRIERILKRDPKRNIADIEKIMANQKSEEEFKSVADYIIQNNENELLIPQVLSIHEQILLKINA